MKLNYRDKVLLTALIVILVWIAGIMLFIKPAIDDVSAAQTELDDAQVTLSDKQAQIEADKDLQQRIDTAYEEVEKVSKRFYDYQETQEATQKVDDLLATSGHEITNTNMTISSYSTTTLKPFSYKDDQITTDIDQIVDEYNAVTSDADETTDADSTVTDLIEQTIGKYTISFNFEGKADDVKYFCDTLKSNDEKTLLVNSLSINVDSDGGDTVTGRMELNMMVLNKLSDPTADQ
jgi:hypothetical protein